MSESGVIRFDRHIDTRPYERRWGHRPDGRSELWLVMRAGSGWAEWYSGPYGRLVKTLDRRDQWTLYAPSQALTSDPKSFVHRLR